MQASSRSANDDAIVAVLKELQKQKEAAQGAEQTEVKLIVSGTDLARALNRGNEPVRGILTRRGN